MVLRDFDVIQTFELRNNLQLPLHFKLETRLPFEVLKPASLQAYTRSSCSPHAEDGPYLSLQPQQRTLVGILAILHNVQLCSVQLQLIKSVFSLYDFKQVKVAFCCTPALLDHAEQAEEEIPPGVRLIESKRSQRTLQFQQDLLIHYSNNTLQVGEAENLN